MNVHEKAFYLPGRDKTLKEKIVSGNTIIGTYITGLQGVTSLSYDL